VITPFVVVLFNRLLTARQFPASFTEAFFTSVVKKPGLEVLVISRLDFGNSVLISLPTHLVRRLQSVQNAVALLIFKLLRYDHITDALVTLHWLSISERVVYEITVLTFKVLHGIGPEYLGPVVRVADLPGRRAICSAGTNRLVVPRSNCQQLALVISLHGSRSSRLEQSASRHYVGTVDLPSKTENSPIQTFITCKRVSAALVRTCCCSYGKGQILHLSRAVTTVPINTKFLTIDYLGEIKRIAKFGCNQF